jgi:hypothetical protein
MTSAEKEVIAQRNKNAVPDIIAIDPNGKKYKFNSLSETEEFVKCGPLFKQLPDDGMPYKGQKLAKKNWIFYKDIPNKKRAGIIKSLRKEIVESLKPVKLKQPWRSPIWRASPEGQVYMAELEKRRNAPNKKNKRVMTPDGMFETNKLAADFYNINTATFGGRKREYPELYYNCDADGKRITDQVQQNKAIRSGRYGRKVVTPDGIFDSADKAGKYYNVTHATIRNWIKNKSDFYWGELNDYSIINK